MQLRTQFSLFFVHVGRIHERERGEGGGGGTTTTKKVADCKFGIKGIEKRGAFESSSSTSKTHKPRTSALRTGCQ